MKKNTFLFIFLLLLAFVPFSGKAEYKTSIVCPNDGKDYVVVVKTTDGETKGPEAFDPFSGSEYCLPGKIGGSVSGQVLLNTNVYSALDANSDVQPEIVECTEATFGGKDNYDWDNLYDAKPLKEKTFLLNTTFGGVSCGIGSKDSKTRRMRYSIKGTYLYVVGAYVPPAGTTNPEALKALCGAKNKDQCDADPVNCKYAQLFCYPKTIGEQKDKEAKSGTGSEGTIICSSLCSQKSVDCPVVCGKESSCIFFKNQCMAKADLTPEEQQNAFAGAFKNSINEKYPAPEGSNFLPDCAYPGTCDDVNDLLILLINVAKFLFKIIGTAAFAFFIYGGFTMVLSMGNSDRVKSGRDTLVAAVIGLIIAFSAYLLVDVVLDVLQVSDEYRNVGSINKK